MKIIRFKREGSKYWEIAFNEKHLAAKLNGDMATVIMPAKNIFIRLYRIFFPLKGIDGNTLINGEKQHG